MVDSSLLTADIIFAISVVPSFGPPGVNLFRYCSSATQVVIFGDLCLVLWSWPLNVLDLCLEYHCLKKKQQKKQYLLNFETFTFQSHSSCECLSTLFLRILCVLVQRMVLINVLMYVYVNVL